MTTIHESRGLPTPLDEALSSRMPSGPLPPGPRTNPWERAGAVRHDPGRGAGELVDALWHPGEFHRREDGSATRIRRRPVPSAGACYPVQTHLVDARGGRGVFDLETGTFLRRDLRADRAAGWPAPRETSGSARLVFTVLPGRSFGRYRHRAWPLWIADAAYAVAAVRFLLGPRGGPVEVGPSAALRSLLGVPAAADAAGWLRRGLAPEIPLASVEIAEDLIPDAATRRALRERRSPPTQEFAARAAAPRARDQANVRDQADPRGIRLMRQDCLRSAGAVEQVARASGQAWVRGATAVHSWSLPADAPAAVVRAALWNAHLAAARLCYEAALAGDRGARPISGFAATGGRWILHAVAFLDSPGGT